MPQRLNLPPKTINAFRHDLVRWYRRHRRALPWRGSRDPYRIWVSEIMLQQTRVETVRDYYRRWLAAFPTLASLARAPESRVLKLWEGLGYYSRARNLHRAAQQLVGRACCLSAPHRAQIRRTAEAAVPTTVDELMKLPGIGRYTAGAIASIAFDQRAPVVDGNVARVFDRVFARGDRHWELAETLLPARGCGDFNQALMELGALVCVPVNPRCRQCPLRPVCRTRSDARPARKRRILQPVTHDVLYVERAGKILLRQRPATGLLAGMWELPAGKSRRLLLTHRHVITHRQITLRVFAGRQATGKWFTRRQVENLALPAAHRRALNAIATPAHPSAATASRTRR
jgi:A/G-specific adenine glycosylase